MLDVMELESGRAKMLAEPLRMAEHSQIAVADLCDTPVGPRLEHVARDEERLCGLHRLVPQYPWLPVMAHVLNLGERDARAIKTEPDRIVRKPE